MHLRILQPGMRATLQDLGRPQWRASGVPPGGAADLWSHRIANALLGNTDHAATLEVIGGGCRIEIVEAGWLAWAGLGATLHINGLQSGTGRLAYLPAGTVCEFQATLQGHYTYLACSGGWQVPVVLDSRSTCLAAGFGGLQGRLVGSGDVLQAEKVVQINRPGIWVSRFFAAPTLQAYPDSVVSKKPSVASDPLIVRTLPGPERSCWTTYQKSLWAAMPFVVTPQLDRMGMRLRATDGADFRVMNPVGGLMASSAVQPGTIQLPPDGGPIVLLADAQCTGGYPRVAQVIATDLPLLAQCPVGRKVLFQDVTLKEAEQALLQQEYILHRLKLAVQMQRIC